jgi:hypothetical protein
MNKKYVGNICLSVRMFDSRNSSSNFGKSWYSGVHQKLLGVHIILIQMSISYILHETHTDLIKFL